MEDRQLIESLLKRQESDDLDFKSGQYNFANNDGKSKFIKDIIAMANTPRSGPAYILVGVQEQSGKVRDITGVTDHPDEAMLGGIVSGKVDPTPRFTYRQIAYDGVNLGLIDIPCNQPVPIMPRTDYGVLRRGCVYIRRNTQNTEADKTDLARINEINEWGQIQREPSSDSSTPSGAWEQLYRACDGFDPQRVYIAVLDRETSTEIRDWTAMAGIHWNIIIDFDTRTDTDSNHAVAKGPFGERHALQLSALDDSVTMTRRSTIWVAAAGLDSRPTTNPSGNWRDWNRSKVPQLERTISDLAIITEPSPVTLIIFGGEANYVSTTCEIADRAFTYRVDYVFANPNLKQYSGIAERFGASTVSIMFPEVCQGLRDLQQDSGPIKETLFPKLAGGTAVIPPDRARWMEEQLELVHWDVGLSVDEQTDGDLFLKGAIVGWYDLNIGAFDVDRDVTTKLEQRIRKEIEARATRRVNLWHSPGAGGTTVARRIAWNIHRQFPTVVAREIQPKETAERLRHLFGETRLPILVVIDLPGVTKEVVDRLYDELRSSHTHAVLFNVERRFDSGVDSGTHYLDAMLTTREAFALSGVLAARLPERRSDLESLIDEVDRRKRSPFYFGLTAYGRDFQGIEPYVEARLSQASDPVRNAVLFMAFAYYYGQVSLSLQTFGPVLGIPASKLIAMAKVIPDYVRELLVQADVGVRPAHYLIAEEILHQELGRTSSDWRNWRVGLADLATKFIDLSSDLPHRSRGITSDILRAVLIERGSAQSPAGPWDTEFSPLLEDVPNVDGRRRVLDHLTDTFPEEPHFWAHLGRFYSRVDRDHEKAHTAHQTALGLLPNDPLLHHMAGMGWRAELYGMLDSVNSDFGREYEAKIFEIVGEASKEFGSSRSLDRRSEYSYISQVQMNLRVVGTASSSKGYRHDVMKFLTLPGNDSYRELVDQAQNLLSDLALIKGSEIPSQLQVTLQAGLERLHGKHSEAIQHLTNALDRRESYRPPIRRAIIRAYAARHEDDWSRLTERELARVVELSRDNIVEEPASDYNLRLWLRAVRTENALSVNSVAEQLSYKRLQSPSVDTTYYLYIMKFLQLESGDLAVAREVPDLIEECSRLARDLSRTTTSYEWLGNETGLAALVHFSTLGVWDDEKRFWPNTEHLCAVRGRIAQIRNQGSGEIELPSGLRAFFVPSSGTVPGGYIAGQDIGREVEFFLGFSYDGLRAWSVHDPR